MNWDCCSYCDLGSYPGNTYTRNGWDYPHGDEDDVAEPTLTGLPPSLTAAYCD